MSDLVSWQRRIEAEMLHGHTLDWVEAHLINNQERFDEEEKAVLWLYAWSCLPSERARFDAQLMARAMD